MISFIDFLILPIYMVVFYFLGNITVKNRIDENPEYEYYQRGLIYKVLGGLALCIVYTQYYEGGDTTAYFTSSVSLYKMLWKEPDIFWKIMSNDLQWEYYYHFDHDMGYPGYYRDPQSFTVVRYTCLLHFFSFKSYILTTAIVSFISYQGIWRLYMLFCDLYPGLRRQFFFSILVIPSVLFWASGILKDTYTLMAACWFTFSFYKAFIKVEKVFINLVLMVIMATIMIQIKPYVFLALLPGSLIWFTFHRVKDIKNPILKAMLFPVLAGAVALVGALAFSTIKDSLGQYSSVEKILDKAVVTQNDLKQEYYAGNSFDIGYFEPTVAGILSKFPVATVAGLFRPFIWEARNPVMVISALENLVLLLLSLYLLLRSGPIVFARGVASEPLVLFSFLFSITFAFSVGLTTSNFGALVRYKVPSIPFFLSSLIILYNLAYNYEEVFKRNNEEEEENEDEASTNLVPSA